jgi:hypothetical protein
VDSPALSNIRIESITPTFRALGTKLAAAAYFAATNLGNVTDIRVTDVRAPNAVTTGVMFDIDFQKFNFLGYAVVPPSG